MKRLLLVFPLLLTIFIGPAKRAGAQADPAPPVKMSADRLDDRIIVRLNDQTLTCYRFGAGQKYPYFYPVNGPVSGLPLTTESSLPWPHHRSLFFGCDKVNGGNYWQEGNEQGQIVSNGPSIAHGGPDYVEIVDECEWRKPGQTAIIKDKRVIRIEAPSAKLRLIDFGVTLIPLTEIRILRTNHSLFSARVVPALSVRQGGTLVNAGGNVAEKGTYGVSSPWCDYSGMLCGAREGLAIFDSPRNRWFPSKWFTRDYGFFSPTPFEWLDKDGLQLKAGEQLELNYRVVLHAGDATDAGIAKLFSEWVEKR
ncbi:MAG: hypothetical protein EHM23_19355 [Acidobacteria bacterium]|nr:MAG: hypothetical protein EHM23_19355 [Acidobacteriota bacterium]